MVVLSHLDKVALVMSLEWFRLSDMNSALCEGALNLSVLALYSLSALTGHRAKSSDLWSTTADRGGMRMWGDMSSGFWFLARNSGRNLRQRAPLLVVEMSPLIPDRLVISEALLPEARAIRKTVLKVRCFKSSILFTFIFFDLRKLRTTAKSHFGVSTLSLWLTLAAPFITAEILGSSVIVVFPLAAKTELKAALLALRVAAVRLSVVER